MIILKDEMTIWWEDVFANNKEKARKRALSLLEEGLKADSGCIVTGTQARRKVRFKGRQLAAYRFIYCVLTETVPQPEDVVRHRCHEKTCINPDHLTIGSKADNKHDDWAYAAYGVDPKFL